MTNNMSAGELIAELQKMAERLRDIRVNDEGGWRPSVKALLKGIELRIRSDVADLEDR